MALQLNWIGKNFGRNTGYGRISINMMRALQRQGIQPIPVSVGCLNWEGELQRMAGIRFDRLSLACLPADQIDTAVPGRLWLYTMYETTRPPTQLMFGADCAERLLVPCQWVGEVFRQAGLHPRIPVSVIEPGIDPLEFHYIERDYSGDRPYTFLVFNDRTHKGDLIAYQAFFDAFHGVDDVRFVYKCTEDHHADMDLTAFDSRVSLWRENVDSMASVYAQVDCLVFPSFGEGWGLPPREAAATGLPVIATNWGGLAVDIEDYAIPIRNYKMAPAQLYGGEWAFPDREEVAAHMRWCYENRDQAKADARMRSDKMRAKTWDKSARALLELIGATYQAYLPKGGTDAAD